MKIEEYEAEIYRLKLLLAKYKKKEYSAKKEACKQLLGVIENVPFITVDLIKDILLYEIEEDGE